MKLSKVWAVHSPLGNTVHDFTALSRQRAPWVASPQQKMNLCWTCSAEVSEQSWDAPSNLVQQDCNTLKSLTNQRCVKNHFTCCDHLPQSDEEIWSLLDTMWGHYLKTSPPRSSRSRSPPCWSRRNCVGSVLPVGFEAGPGSGSAPAAGWPAQRMRAWQRWGACWVSYSPWRCRGCGCAGWGSSWWRCTRWGTESSEEEDHPDPGSHPGSGCCSTAAGVHGGRSGPAGMGSHQTESSCGSPWWRWSRCLLRCQTEGNPGPLDGRNSPGLRGRLRTGNRGRALVTDGFALKQSAQKFITYFMLSPKMSQANTTQAAPALTFDLLQRHLLSARAARWKRGMKNPHPPGWSQNFTTLKTKCQHWTQAWKWVSKALTICILNTQQVFVRTARHPQATVLHLEAGDWSRNMSNDFLSRIILLPSLRPRLKQFKGNLKD